MNILRKNIKFILGFIIGSIITAGVTVYAYSYLASSIGYIKDGNTISVENALDELYKITATMNQSSSTATEIIKVDSFTLEYNNGALYEYETSFNPNLLYFVNEDYYIWGYKGDSNFYYTIRSNGNSGYISNGFYVYNDHIEYKMGNSSASGTLYLIK